MDLIIDLSYWNNAMTSKTYDMVAKNFLGAILRVGYTGYGKPAKTKAHDTAFENHYRELSKRGVLLGAYWYGTDETPAEARVAANRALDLLKGRKLELGVFYDTEDGYYQKYMRKKDLTDTVLAFTERIRLNSDYITGVYASSYWFKDNLDFARLKNEIIWEANYGKNTGKIDSSVMFNSHIHQYTSMYSLDGQRFDSNVLLKKYWNVKGDPIKDKPVEVEFGSGNKVILKQGARAVSLSSHYNGMPINSYYIGKELNYSLTNVNVDWVYIDAIETYVHKNDCSFVGEVVEVGSKGLAKIKSGAKARSLSTAYDGVEIGSWVIGKEMKYLENQVKGKDWVYFPEIMTYVERKDVTFV